MAVVFYCSTLLHRGLATRPSWRAHHLLLLLFEARVRDSLPLPANQPAIMALHDPPPLFPGGGMCHLARGHTSHGAADEAGAPPPRPRPLRRPSSIGERDLQFPAAALRPSPRQQRRSERSGGSPSDRTKGIVRGAMLLETTIYYIAPRAMPACETARTVQAAQYPEASS